MKGFAKLALASAIIAASSGAFAMQALDDDAMSAATGQDGLTIRLDTNLSGVGVKYIDRDGVVGDATYANAGALIINPIGVVQSQTQIDIDVGGSTAAGVAGTGMLNISITNPNDTVIELNNGTYTYAWDAAGAVTRTTVTAGTAGTTVAVADADATGSATGTAKDIISFNTDSHVIISGSATPAINIQLGNETQGSMIAMTSDIASLTLTGMSINDAGGLNSGGAVTIGTLSVANIHAVNAIDVVAGGLRIDTAGTSIGAVGLEDVRLGDATQATIGDIYITGLTSNGVITVTGH